ncbi:MAG: hypothetical protein ACOC7O_02895 [Thermoplasmatota archaeon]
MNEKTKDGKGSEAPQDLSKNGREDSQENGIMGILAVVLFVIAAIIYFFGTDTLIDIFSKLSVVV